MTSEAKEIENTIENQTSFGSLAIELALGVWKRFQEDRCLRVAASLSYTSLLALVPFAAIFFAMLSAFPVFEGVREQIQTFMFENFIPSSGAVAGEYFDKFMANTGKLTAVGSIGLAVTAVLMLATIEAALNVIFRVPVLRGIVPRFLVYWALVTLGPLLLGASLSLSTYLFAMSKFVGEDFTQTFGGYFTSALPTMMVMVALSLVYLVIPNKRVRLRHAIAGGITAGLLFAILRTWFGAYVAGGSAYTTIYGAMATIPVFLVWMYLTWSVVLIGAVLTAVLGENWQNRKTKVAEENPVPRLEHTLKLLGVLHQASLKEGGALTTKEIVENAKTTENSSENVLIALQLGKFVEKTQEEKWVLARNLEAATLFDLSEAMKIIQRHPVKEGDEGDVAELLRDADKGRQENLGLKLSQLIMNESKQID
ncbi:MAG: YihY family inner membrane protein [Alphaproteobacteria bacterium]|nr:YihY family inner membrane protein [Rhodospirillales bacterium]MCW9046041.1 YihY family inner membrane protein [Alphaproteobacteria bacterium]